MGRNIFVTNPYSNIPYHENYHLQDIDRLGWIRFYSTILHEYQKYGFHGSYNQEGSLEWNADKYMSIKINL